MIKNGETKVIEDEFLPLQEIPLAAGNISLVREVLPNLYIYPTNKHCISVEGLLRSDVKNGDLYAAVEEHLKDKPHADISFAKKALTRFYKEYSLLRENGMDCLLHAAQYRGIPFNFCKKLTDSKGSESTAPAWYNSVGDKIEFLCDKYTPESGNYNTLAHELTHMIMKDENAVDFVASSPFGVAVYALYEANALLAGPCFDKARKEYIQENKQKDTNNASDQKGKSDQEKYGHYSGSFFSQWHTKRYKAILSSPSYQRGSVQETLLARTKEIFASLMEYVGDHAKGMKGFQNIPTSIIAPYTEPLCKIAELTALHDQEGLEIVKNTIMKFNLPDKLMHDAGLLIDKKTQLAMGIGNSKQDLIDYSGKIIAFEKQLFAEKEKLMKQINDRLAQLPNRKELSEKRKNMETILRAHSAALKNNPPITSEEKKKALIAEQKAANTQARITNLPDTHDRHNSNLPTLREHWTFLSPKTQKTN